MQAYASETAEAAFAASSTRFDGLVAWLTGDQAAGMTHAQLEERLHTEGLGLLRQQVLSVLLAADKAMTPGQVRDAIDADVAYTTVMTVLNRLSEQGLAA